MFKAGKMVLLLTTFCVFLGATPQLHAQEKLLPISVGFTKTNRPCTQLQGLLVTKVDGCEEKKLTQVEKIILAEAKNVSDLPVEFSYSSDPTYYAQSVSDASPTPIPTDTPTATPTQPPIQTATSSTQLPADNVPADAASLDSNLIFDLINEHRAQIGKPAFQKDEPLCELAKTRSLELHDELFVNHNLHSGLYNRNLPYWITENAKWGSNEAGTVQWWLNSPIHRKAIEGDYVYSCGACNGSMCSQLFTSYTPKNSNPQASLNATPPQL